MSASGPTPKAVALQMVAAPCQESSDRVVVTLERGSLSRVILNVLLEIDTAIENGACVLLAGRSLVEHKLPKRFAAVVGGESQELVIKFLQFNPRLAQLPIPQLQRKSAVAQWNKTHAVADAGIATVKPTACGTLRYRGTMFAFSAMESLRALPDIATYLKQDRTSAGDQKLAAQAIYQFLAAGLVQAHASGFFHSDIKSYHILIDTSREAQPTWVWLDLDDTKLVNQLTRKQIVENLYQLWRYVLEPIDSGGLRGFIEAYLVLAESSGIKAVARDREESLAASVTAHYQQRLARSARRS